MNLFVVHEDPKTAAIQLCDQHIVKLPTECVQILCTVYELEKIRIRNELIRGALVTDIPSLRLRYLNALKELDVAASAPMKPVRPLHHKQHPIIRWAVDLSNNLRWIKQHTIALFNEFEYRFGHPHGSLLKFNDLYHVVPEIQRIGRPFGFRPFGISRRRFLLTFVPCMPRKYKNSTGPTYGYDPITYSSWDTVAAYRQYYIEEKSRFARWAHRRPPPDWWPYSTSVPPHGTLSTCPDPLHEASPSASH